MHRYHGYNENMKTLIYVHSNGSLGKDNEANCPHGIVETVEFKSTYVTYDGVEMCITKGSACVDCGLLLNGYFQDDVAAIEDNLMNLLEK